MYVMGNPITYNDPSGKRRCEGVFGCHYGGDTIYNKNSELYGLEELIYSMMCWNI